MFLDQARPLYRSAMHYPIAPKHWLPFIAKRFVDAKKGFDEDLIRAVCERTQGHPFYTQHLCHVLWSMIEPGSAVVAHDIDQAIAELLRRESHAYITLWELLTKNEQRFLRDSADREIPPQAFSADFTRQYGLRTASNAQRAADSLIAKDLIEREAA